MRNPDRPNIVVILPDQLRPDFLRCYGGEMVDTPAIDAIAAAGVRYTRAYSSAPICVPARTAFQTGLHPLRSGVLDNSQGLRPDYHALGIRTWPELLASAGYETAGVGKTHFYPWDSRQGFQHRVIAEDKRHLEVRDDYWWYLRARGERKYHGVEHEGYADNLGAVLSKLPAELSIDAFVARSAADYIQTRATHAAPFALFVGFPGPHDPYDPTPQMLERVRESAIRPAAPAAPDVAAMRRTIAGGVMLPWGQLDTTDMQPDAIRTMRTHYAALVAHIDDGVAQIVSALEHANVADNTVVIIASDHGDTLGDHGFFGKGTYYESSTRIPMIVSVPGGPSGTTDDCLVDLYDLNPTILALAGVDIPAITDASPLAGVVPSVGTRRQSIVGATSYGWMLRTERYKLHRYYTGEFLLFDMDADPDEQHDLARDPEYRQVYDALEQELTAAVMRLIFRGRDDLVISSSDGPVGEGVFEAEGWHRHYPRAYAACGDHSGLPQDITAPGYLWSLAGMSGEGGHG